MVCERWSVTCVKDGVWQSGVKDGMSKMVCDGVWKILCDKVVCERSCVTKLCVKDGVWQSCVWKMVCDKVVCERLCERSCVKVGVWKTFLGIGITPHPLANRLAPNPNGGRTPLSFRSLFFSICLPLCSTVFPGLPSCNFLIFPTVSSVSLVFPSGFSKLAIHFFLQFKGSFTGFLHFPPFSPCFYDFPSFPTCQVRVVRFYHSSSTSSLSSSSSSSSFTSTTSASTSTSTSALPTLPSSPTSAHSGHCWAPTAGLRSEWARLDLNCKVLSAVGTAGRQLGTFRAQWAPLDLNLGPSELSGHRWTSAARWNARIYARKTARIYAR